MNARAALRFVAALACLGAGGAIWGQDAQERVLPLARSGLDLTVPADWTSEKPIDGATLILRGPAPKDDALDADARERARPSVAVAVVALPSDQTQGGMAYEAYKDLERLLTHFDPLRDREYTRTIGGRAWQCWHYTFLIGQLEFEQELFLTVNELPSGRWLVYLVGSCDHEHFAAARPAIERMLESTGGSRPTLDK